MARGKTLNELVEELRAETRRSSDSSRGIDNRAYLEQIIRRTYEALWDEYDWPMTRAIRDITINAGQRYYDFPSDMDYENVRNVHTKDGSVWIPVTRGITDRQYTHIDSDENERSSPILKWDIIDVGADEQIEVWPMPDSAAELRLRGYRNRTLLVDQNDRAELDGTMIVLFAAATVYSDSKQRESANDRAKAAERRLMRVRARNSADIPVNLSTAGSDPYEDNYGKQYIPRAVYNDRTP